MNNSDIVEGTIKATLSSVPALWTYVKRKFSKKKKISEDQIKQLTNTLFIDDEKFEYIDRIREAGWNATQIFELRNLDDEAVRKADIIFLDYKGVGTVLSPTKEGLGLLKFLKAKYPSKIIIFYSAHAGFSLGDEFKDADDWLAKNSDPIYYIQKIEESARKIHGY